MVTTLAFVNIIDPWAGRSPFQSIFGQFDVVLGNSSVTLFF